MKMDGLRKAMPIPAVHTGGTSDVAIAVPVRAAEKCLCATVNAAAEPPKKAIIRSIRDGLMRERTSLEKTGLMH